MDEEPTLSDWEVSETLTFRFSRDGKEIGFFTEQGKMPVKMRRGDTEGTRPILDHLGAILGLVLWAEPATARKPEQ